MTDKNILSESTSVPPLLKIAILDEENQLLFADYEHPFCKHSGNSFAHLLGEAHEKLAN